MPWDATRAGRGSGGPDRRSHADLAVAEDVGAEPAAVDERPQDPGPAEPFQVGARFAQAAPLAEHVPDAEGATHEGVDVDAPGEDVAPGTGEVQRLPGRGQLVEDLGGHQRQVVPGSPAGAGAEGAGTCGVAVPV